MAAGAQVQPLIERAFALHRSGHYAEAEALYRALLVDSPAVPPACTLLGALCLQTGRAQEAFELLRKAAKIEPGNAATHANLGLALLARGDHAAALASCDRALTLAPAYPEALNSRGNALAGLGRTEEALASYERALGLRRDYVEAHCNRGRMLEELHRVDEAIDAFARVLELQPGHVEALLRSANQLLKKGCAEEAIGYYDRLLDLQPNAATVLSNRGNALLALGKVEEAHTSYERALAAAPELPEALNNLGNVLLLLGRNDEALAACAKAIALRPDFAEAYNNRGSALVALARPEDALPDLELAIALRPGLAQAHANRGNALSELRRYGQAQASYARSLELNPQYPGAYRGHGTMLMDLRQYGNALADFDRAIALDSGYTVAFGNRAFALRMLGRPEEACRDLARVLELSPRHPYAEGGRLHFQLQCCDWTDLEQRIVQVRSAVHAGSEAALPFHFLGMSVSPAEQLDCARVFAKAERIEEPTAAGVNETYWHDRVRVAYLSADLHEHATAYLTAEMFERHDRQRFEVFGVSYGPDDGSPMRDRLRRAFDRFLDAREMNDREAADWIRAQEIDIVVDLKGYTADARAGILMHRAAPVQVNYLGYPGTLGVPYIDYIIADKFVIPVDDERWYSEKVVRLPNSYQVNDSRRAIDDHTPTRTELGLPDDGFVFCCFNNSYKILPNVFAVWMRLLASVPGSVLWLLADNEAATRNLRREAARVGVAPERLVLAPRAKLGAHLARQRRADLFLDTLPYNAHTTASDALWAGLPVLTCAGSTFAGRVAGSLLHAAGLGALVTHTLEDYEALALTLATTPELLTSLRAKLARERNGCALFDVRRFARDVESAYLTMHARSQAGLAPESFDVRFDATVSGDA